MAKVTTEPKFSDSKPRPPNDAVNVNVLRVICSDCGQAVSDETLECIVNEEEITPLTALPAETRSPLTFGAHFITWQARTAETRR